MNHAIYFLLNFFTFVRLESSHEYEKFVIGFKSVEGGLWGIIIQGAPIIFENVFDFKNVDFSIEFSTPLVILG